MRRRRGFFCISRGKLNFAAVVHDLLFGFDVVAVAAGNAHQAVVASCVQLFETNEEPLAIFVQL